MPSKFVKFAFYYIINVEIDNVFIASFSNVWFYSQPKIVLLSFTHFLITKAVTFYIAFPVYLWILTSSEAVTKIIGVYFQVVSHYYLVFSSRLKSFSLVQGLKIYFILVKGEDLGF